MLHAIMQYVGCTKIARIELERWEFKGAKMKMALVVPRETEGKKRLKHVKLAPGS